MAASAWHWRTLGVKPWAEEWLADQLVSLEAGGVRITRISAVDGDCELGSRKGKLLTIYDLRIECEWAGKAAGGDEIKGSLTCPEMSHDMEEDAYEFESAVTTGSGADADKLRQVARTKLADLLRPKFTAFPKAMLDTHSKTLRAQADASPSGSGTSTPSNGQAPVKSAASGVQLPDVGRSTNGGVVNSSTVRVSADFMTNAADLFELLTDANKVPMWSRNPAKIRPEKGAEVSLFNGNITGEVIEVDAPRKIVCTWRAPTWPAGYFGQLHTTLNQGADSTTLELRLTGVPKGEEDTTERNLDTFYIRSLKAIGAPTSGVLNVIAANILPFLVSFGLVASMVAAIYFGPTGSG